MINQKLLIVHESKIIIVSVTIVLLGVMNYFVWFDFLYPAEVGHVDYETRLPEDFNITQAGQRLEEKGYLCELEIDQIHYSSLIFSDIPDLKRYFNLFIDEESNVIHINAYEDVPHHLSEYVFQDLMEIESHYQDHAEREIRNIIIILDLPDDGTFSYRDKIDDDDYSIPSTIFYINIYINLLVIVVLISFIIFYRKKQIPQQPDEPSFPVRADRGQSN